MSCFARRCLALLAGAAVLLSAASCSEGKSFEIPASYQTSDAQYTLLYSTLGYELAGAKRVLIRQNDVDAAVSEGLSFSWRLVDDGDGVALEGRAAYSGTGWGIPIWTVDFSALDEAGRYRIVVEAPEVRLATQEFAVDEFLLFRTTFDAVAIQNAAAREAPIELDYGFYDSNGKTGSAAAHADWLVGLIEAYERRRNVITEEQRRQMRDAISRSVDYLLLLADPATGEFRSTSPTRGAGITGPHNTAMGMRALARYAVAFHNEDPVKAERAHRRSLVAELWLAANAPDAYPPALRATVNYDFYRYALIDTYMDVAAAALREQIGTYDLRTMERPSDDSLPHVEGLYRMWRDLTSHPDRQLWANAATAIAAQYMQIFQANPFAIVPPGITSEEFDTNAIAEWDEVATEPPPGAGDDGALLNTWFMARAIDAAHLADMTGDANLGVMAAAGIGWITGLNPGVPVERVRTTDGASEVEAASFLTGLPVSTARPWAIWEWLRPRRHGTIVNGFRADFAYDDGFAAGETALANDGMWLYAMTAYEDFLQPARRSPAPDGLPPFARAMHVASADASSTGGTLQLLVRVQDAAGAPLPAVRVIVLWEGVPLEDALPEDALTTSACVTGADGSCLATIAGGALAAEPPFTAAVANLEHDEHGYDINADDPSKIQTIP
ncbi:MAG: hypothetical protein WEB52_09930 [Dehalococcoidia bacterium]